MAADVADIASRKADLRKKVRARVKLLDGDELTRQSEAVCERVVQMSWYTSSQKIGIFLSMPKGEFRTEPILRHAFAQGKQVYCPRVMGDGWMELFEVASAEEALQLPLSKWRIPEPSAEKPQVQPKDLDLLFVPAVALNLSRRRCGHGMGFYDRYIARTRAEADAKKRCQTVGLALSEQMEEGIPEEEHDEPLDAVFFPDAESLAQGDESADIRGPF